MMKILDCTFRDGGYYNSWDFDSELTGKYIQAMKQSKIDVVELGFRNFPKNEFMGAYAYTTDDYINTLDLPKTITYGVMVDAKTILDSNLTIESSIDKLFLNKKDSLISLVRIAAHFNEVDKCEVIAKYLKKLGYIIGFNLMQSAGKSDDILKEKAKQISEWSCVDVLYFADSLGNMDSNEVIRIINNLKEYWKGELGFHAHNNMALALTNTMVAHENGVEWLDVTVSGMGRGAGNAQTENILSLLSKRDTKYSANPVYDLVIRYFEQLQKKYEWGSNLLYFIGAQNNVHPMYIQKILSNERYGVDEILGAIDYLSKSESSSFYVSDLLEQALMPTLTNDSFSSKFDLVDKYREKDILLVGNGPSTKKYKSDIERYIKKYTPIVFSVNMNDWISDDYIDYYVISHNSKFLADKERYKFINKPIILPKHRFDESEMFYFKHVKLFDYGIKIDKNNLEINNHNCTLPSELTAAYAISAAIEMGANQLYLVGFDGYNKDDPRQQELIDFWILFKDLCKQQKVISLTPTTYPIQKGSLYAPKL